MASIRRTLSPGNHDRSQYPNGSSFSPFSSGSGSQKSISNSRSSSSLPSIFVAFFVGLRRFLSGVGFPQKYARRGGGGVAGYELWKKPFYKFSFLFLIGFLFGMMPFGQIDEIKSHDFPFEMIKPPVVDIQLEKIMDDNGIVVQRDNDAGAGSDVEISQVSLAERAMKEKFDYNPRRKLLIVVTPTYNRALQGYYLNRMVQLLRLVNPPLLWIVVEMESQSAETAEILRKSGIMYRHLVYSKNLTDIKDRGVQQRNTALQHIEAHRLDGVVYFADDDNIYSLELFERLREISRFGTWPVAMLAQSKSKAILEGPVCNGSQVIGWHTNEKSKKLRRFHVDMSGFAFNSTILWDPKIWKRPRLDPIRQLNTVKEGFQETTFIEQLVADESQMEGIPSGCERIMNWHLHLEARGVVYPTGWMLQNNLDASLPLN